MRRVGTRAGHADLPVLAAIVVDRGAMLTVVQDVPTPVRRRRS